MKNSIFIKKARIIAKTFWEFNVALVADFVLYYLSYSIYNTTNTWNYTTKEYILICIFSFVFFLAATAYFIHMGKQFVSHIKLEFSDLKEKNNGSSLN